MLSLPTVILWAVISLRNAVTPVAGFDRLLCSSSNTMRWRPRAINRRVMATIEKLRETEGTGNLSVQNLRGQVHYHVEQGLAGKAILSVLCTGGRSVSGSSGVLHLRGGGPVVTAPATSHALAATASGIGKLRETE